MSLPYEPITEQPEFIKPAITGYRKLSAEELDLINLAKAHAETLGLFVEHLKSVSTLDQRWVAEGKTDLQKGFMSLVRAIAQPTTF